MRFSRPSRQPEFNCFCVCCGTSLNSVRDEIYADLDGKAFRDYYCKECRDIAEQNERDSNNETVGEQDS